MVASTESDCRLRLGDTGQAAVAAETALAAIAPSFVRNRAMITLRLGVCRLRAARPDVAGAAEAFAAATVLAGRHRSVRLAGRLTRGWRELDRWRGTPEVETVRAQLGAAGLL
jgi:hypothetical protein